MFSSILIANRGEIAVRIERACEELGIATIAVYSELDRDAPHVTRAGQAYLLGPGPAAESYLSIGKLLGVAERSGAEAVHPGYGFLAENAAFAAALRERGIEFVGPSPEAIEAMGSKTRARALMARAGVPIVPGTTQPVATIDAARKLIEATIAYPVAIKATGGGGGKGFRVARSEDELPEAFEGAAREGEKFFADPAVYLERYLADPRHVEVQVLADAHGNVVHLGERDCSLQRRHQKLIEEAPAPAVDARLRERIGTIATEAAAAVAYTGAGTIEGLLTEPEEASGSEGASESERGSEYFFLEMNTRVQVEHCVTEMVTGIDIVKEGIRIAAGEPLSISQRDVELRGHAIECRINAEDASRGFAPAPGTIGGYREPAGPGVRVDSGVGPGSEVSPAYDPMVAKLIVWDADRAQATARMVRALREYRIEGLTTLLPFHEAILKTRQWAAGETCRDLIEDPEWLKSLAPASGVVGAGGSVGGAADRGSKGEVEHAYTVEVSGKRFEVKVIGATPGGVNSGVSAGPMGGAAGAASASRTPARRAGRSGDSSGVSRGDTLSSPIHGTVLRVAVQPGAAVREGALVCVVEAMKMENEIAAHKSGTIEELPVAVGASVAAGDTIAVIGSG